MDKQDSELMKKIREQFDTAPYPRVPLETPANDDPNFLFIHNLATPFYLRNQKVINTEGKLILDAGCGTGYKALVLAEANPGAKIVGIDISEESVKLARTRLEYQGCYYAEFFDISLYELPQLGLQFDYINCDDVLSLLPDLALGLQAMKSVLKPEGIIRANFHSFLQRINFFRAQEMFKMMGLMDGNPGELEIGLVSQTMSALKNEVFIKSMTWVSDLAEDEEYILMNFLLQADKGATIPEIFSALKAADLEFISMVNWRHWEIMDLFKNPDDLPAFIAMSLPEISLEDRLRLYELLHPIHRLIDFWCGHTNQTEPFVPIAEWDNSQWQEALVHLHPQLRTAQIKEDLLECIAKRRPFEISRYIPLPTTVPILIESTMASCLLPLWERSQPTSALVKRWLQVRPLNLATLESVSEKTAFEEVKELLSRLESFLYVLLEPSERD